MRKIALGTTNMKLSHPRSRKSPDILIRQFIALIMLGTITATYSFAVPYSHERSQSIGNARSIDLRMANPSAVLADDNTPFEIDADQIAKGDQGTLEITFKGGCPKEANKRFAEGYKANIVTPSNSSIEVKNPVVLEDGCKLGIEYQVKKATSATSVRLFIKADAPDDASHGTLTIKIVDEEALPPGPTVPGLEPQVDIMWSVVPEKIVKDNFGGRVGKMFYCVEVVIGNNTGYDLQIASVGFQMGPVKDAAKAASKTFNRVTKKLDESSIARLEAADAQNKAANDEALAATLKADAEIQRIDENAEKEIVDPAQQKCVTKKCAEANRKFIAALQIAAASRTRADALKKAAEQITDTEKNLVDGATADIKHLTNLSRLAYKQKVPVSSYMMARGSVRHGQFWSLRSLLINGLQAFGPFITGFTPYFHVINHQNNFKGAINIISNPLEKGLERVFPDETVDQMQRLDEQLLRDGMIIPNNRQLRTRTFVPKDLLQLDDKFRNDPVMVTMALGDMYLIGDTIQYLNRVSVTSSPSGEITPPPTVNPKPTPDVLNLDDTQEINLTGTNLSGAIVSSTDPNVEIVGNPTTTKTSVNVKIKVKDTATRGSKTLNVTTPSGTVPIPITVRLRPPSIESANAVFSDPAALVAFLPATKSFVHTFTGSFLHEANLLPLQDKLVKFEITKINPDGKSMEVTFTVPENLAAGDYKFAIVNPDNVLDPPAEVANRVITVHVEKRGVPQIDKSSIESPNPLEANPSATTDVTLIVEGPNLNHLLPDQPIIQTSGSPQFALSADSVKSESNTKVRVKLTVPQGAQGDFGFALKNEVGPSVAFPLKVQPQKGVILKAGDEKQDLKIVAEGIGTLTLNGENLQGAKLLPVSGANPGGPNSLTVSGWTITIDSAKSNSGMLTLNMKAPATVTESAITFKVTNSNEAAEKAVTVTVTPKPSTVTGFSVNGVNTVTPSVKVGDTVVLSGQNLSDFKTMTFGKVAVTPTAKDDQQITFTAPPGAAAGAVTITVATSGGSLPIADKFTFIPPPRVPIFPPTVVGGADLDIDGINLANVIEIKIGEVKFLPPAIKSNTAERIKLTVPVGTPSGIITITTPGGTISSSPAALTITPP